MGSSSIVVAKSVLASQAFSLNLRTSKEGGAGMSLIGENFDASIMGRIRDDEYESRSGSDNLEGGGASGDDQDADEKPPRKKRYHRHTPQQIQELEAFFKECPHPDEKQRLELSRRLNLETKQVKFWFQNRRTQMKTQLERHENMNLKQENERLQAENYTIKKAMQHPICNNCGGPAVLGEISYEEHHLRIENARLKEELARICSLADKFLGKSIGPLLGSISPAIPNSSLDLAVGRNGFGMLSPVGAALPMGLDLGDGVSSMLPLTPPSRSTTTMTNSDRSFLLDHALIAMHELIGLVESDSPLWVKSLDGGKEVLNHDEYWRKFNPPCLGTKPVGFVTEATRASGMINISSLALVETLMDVDQWAKMFPYLIARSSIIDVISSGMDGTKNGALQLMQAELQILSPLVPLRQVKFLRFCKQHAEGVWAVVDVSFDLTREHSNASSFLSCRRLPSGCVVQDVPGGGYSKVTWVEHSDYDESVIHNLYRPLISSGIGFGALRWVATLQRQCESIATLLAPGPFIPEISHAGREQMLNLAQRMMDNFCAGVCTSVMRNWDSVDAKNLGPDMKVMTRSSIGNPGEPPGVVLSAATSVWIPVPHRRLFDFLRDERLRSEWDILSNGEPMHEMVNFAKGRERGNCVSLLRASTMATNQNNMLILQETWTDPSCSLIVYAPVDYAAINAVMSGRESAYVALLPSGFAIVPDGCPENAEPNDSNGTLTKGAGGNSSRIGDGNGSLLTIGFQILLNNLHSSNLTPDSVQTVGNLISVTLQKIKDAVVSLNG